MRDYDITCHELVELTTAYVDGAMDARRRTTFEQHLLVCGPCVVHLDQIRVTREALGALPPPPRESQLRVLAALADGLG